MPLSPYVELCCRSAFSFLDGASTPEDLVDRAATLGYDTIVLGDRDGVYGAPRAHQAAAAAGMRVLVGAELTVASRGLYVIVAEPQGYRNLCRLITRGKLRAPKGECHLGWDDLEEHAQGLVALVGREVSRAPDPVSDSYESGTCHALDRLQTLFDDDRLYVAIGRHYDRAQERHTRRLVECARARCLPLVATNAVCHATPVDRRLLDVLTCIRLKTTLEDAGRRLLKNAERHLKPPEEMRRLFRDLPDAVWNTRRIAERCSFTLDNLGYRFPDFPLPPGETTDGYLHRLVFAGARTLYGAVTARVRAQLEHELAVIAKLGLAGYFLIVWEIVEFCRSSRILVQGRGSAANSAVCYALGITAVDPIGMELLFERFLSEERGEWPDIDLDLPSGGQRERVLQHVYQRYGTHGAAMTANVITYRTRSAVREVGKVLGFAPDQIDRLAKLLRVFEFRDGDDELAVQIREAGLDPAAPRVRLLVDLVGRIRHLPRHLGQHSGGMVMAAGRLDDVVPLEPAAMPGRVVVQWDKDDCADLGIIKVDLLGLGMMAVLEEAIPLVREYDGVALDLAHLPQDDPAVYAMLQRADTIGVFQVESRAQMATLPRMRPTRFYDLVVEVAIIRPGPIVGRLVHPYLRRRAGREPVTYPHPSLEPVLRRTLGVPLFQEQLLRIAMTAAGFSGGEAEELRRAMSFKRSRARMERIEGRLRSGMAAHGIEGEVAESIIHGISAFALYGFPESHAASFALIVYASTYLKAHHQTAFYCAILNNWPMGFYHPATLVQDAERHDVRVVPIDVTRSNWKCTIEDGALRLGLRYVVGLREATGQRIEAERTRRPFASLSDLVRRCAIYEDERVQLARAGACVAFGGHRRDVLWQMAALERDPKSLLASVERPTRTPLAAPSRLEETLEDYAATGLTTGPHVMVHLRTMLAQQQVHTCADVGRQPDGAWVRMAGHVIVRQRPGTARGMLFLTLEDETGTANAVVTPPMFRRHRRLLHTSSLLVVEGPLQKVDGVVHVRGQRFEELVLSRAPPPSRDFHWVDAQREAKPSGGGTGGDPRIDFAGRRPARGEAERGRNRMDPRTIFRFPALISFR